MQRILSRQIHSRAFHDLLRKPVLAVPTLVVLMLSLVLFALLVLSALAVGGLSDGFNPDSIGKALLGAASAMAVLLLLSGVLSIFAFGMTVAMADEYIRHGETTVEQGWRTGTGRFMDFAVVSVLLGLLLGLGFSLFVLPGLVLLFFSMFTFPALVAERRSALESLKESLAVVRHHLADALVFFGILSGLGLLVWITNALLGRIPLLGPAVSLLLTSAFAAYSALAVVHAYAELQRAFPAATAGPVDVDLDETPAPGKDETGTRDAAS